jgi:hypothetical protein
MDIAGALSLVFIVAVGLGLVAWLSYRLTRWARSGTGGAHMLGAVLTEVTQSPVVHEAKQGRRTRECDASDPPNEE